MDNTKQTARQKSTQNRRRAGGLLFCLCGLCYNLIELLWRGRTHWSMTVAGGLGGLLIVWFNRLFAGCSALKRAFFCGCGITLLEYLTGCLVNQRLGLKVWDYSECRFSVQGQVCPSYFFLWWLLALPVCVVLHKRKH